MINSLCDTDLYKLTMMQVVFEKYTNVNVRYDFKCRTGRVIPEGDNGQMLKELIEWVKHYCTLRFTEEELDYLSDIRFFKPNFIEYLRLFQPNYNYVNITTNGFGNLFITIKGPWISTILFETPLLAMVSELHHVHNNDAGAFLQGKEIFLEKIKYLDNHIHRDSDLRISDFGTRRRFSYNWHKELLRMACHSRYIKSTSNVHFAMKFGLTPMGTMAHEYICAHQQLGRVEDSQKAAFQAWADVYRGDLGIALTDTVGFDAFLRDFDLYFAKLFDGGRHDSGDPHEWCDKLINHYESLGIDPKTKIATFSDGLTFPFIVDLFKRYNSIINTGFGIGTNLTNDVGATPLQIVLKMTECNGRPVAKVSDSPGKGMCQDPKFDEYVRRIFRNERKD